MYLLALRSLKTHQKIRVMDKLLCPLLLFWGNWLSNSLKSPQTAMLSPNKCHKLLSMTHVIAFFNQSGGVGKTTITQNIGYQLTTKGHRVLLLDMDPQASLTTFMGLDVAQLDKTIYDALVSEADEPLAILHDLHSMDLSPANIILANAEQELVLADQRELRLKLPLSQANPVLISINDTLQSFHRLNLTRFYNAA
jgi:Mrp family chromosome partitioning ATPase